MINRIIGVFRLDVATFESIEHDPNATTQAAIVVAIAAVLAGLGSGFAPGADGGFFAGFITTLVWTFVGWFLWSLVSYFVGTTLFNGQATMDEMLRVIGYAYAPQFLGIIPCIGPIVGLIWSLIAGFIAVRQGLDLDNISTLVTIIVGFIVYVIGFAILGLILGGFGALLG